MTKFPGIAAVAIGLLLVAPAALMAQTPDGVIELSGGSVSAGVGFTWGHGTLIFQGRRYPLRISGVSLASVGVTDYTAAGSVDGLKSPEDINGIYSSVSAGATLGGGEDIAAMRNQHGVVIHLTSTTSGLGLSLAAEGMKIRLDK
jgi:hypothetical protein